MEAAVEAVEVLAALTFPFCLGPESPEWMIPLAVLLRERKLYDMLLLLLTHYTKLLDKKMEKNHD